MLFRHVHLQNYCYNVFNFTFRNKSTHLSGTITKAFYKQNWCYWHDRDRCFTILSCLVSETEFFPCRLRSWPQNTKISKNFQYCTYLCSTQLRGHGGRRRMPLPWRTMGEWESWECHVRHWVTVPSDADCSSFVPRTGNPGKNLGLWLSVSSNWHHKLFREKMPLSSGTVRLQNNWEQSLGVHKEFLMRCITSDCLGWGLYVS